MTIHNLINSSNIRENVTCEILHHSPQYAKAAAQIIGDQWNHKEAEIQRNIKSMTEDSRDNLPCHLAILLKLPPIENNGDEENVDVVGHVKLVRASGKGDGSSCISFSLVVAEQYRGLGLGRILTEEAENYVRSLNISYMYLSTSDKVPFYEHLGYKQCEPISSLGGNSKRLNHMQLSALESLYAKRANVDSSSGNTWLRKRLIQEYPLSDIMDFSVCSKLITSSLGLAVESSNELSSEEATLNRYIGLINRLRWQQQTGPSCGISALNMVHDFMCIKQKNNDLPFFDSQNEVMSNSFCNCIGNMKKVEPDSVFDSTLEFAMGLGMTNDGEMFCAHNLAYVAENYNRMRIVVKDISDDDDKNQDNSTGLDVFRSVCKGYPVLIPYDRNHYFIPSQFDGKCAHWAVIVGVILPQSYKKSLNGIDTEKCLEESSPEVGLELHEISASLQINDNNDIFENLADDLLLVCMHGMSEKHFVCSYGDLVASNKQMKVSKTKFYLAPEGLIHLRNKMIFILQ